MKNTESLSIVVQWDEVDDSFSTTYVITWTSERDHIKRSASLVGLTSYTITGLTLDTVYTLTVTAYNVCGTGPEYRTNISLTTDITSATSSPAVTACINTMAIMATANPTTTTAVMNPSTTTTITSATPGDKGKL